jgi:phosphonate transport system permease protein
MKLKTMQKEEKYFTAAAVLLIILYIFAGSAVDFNFGTGLLAVPEALMWLFCNFIPDSQSVSKLPHIMNKLTETVFLSVAAAATASVLALLFALAGSKVTRRNLLLGTAARIIASISRNIPDSVWAMILLLSFGQNILTGFFTLFFVTFGTLTRAFIETIDETSSTTVEALTACGASWWQIVSQGVIPDNIGEIVSWILYEIEVNIRSSTLVGMLTGTGIGFLFDLYYKSMRYSSAGLIILLIAAVTLIIETTSNAIRRRIL